MDLIKYGICSVFVASATLLACGGSTDDGKGSAAGATSSSAGSHANSAGNTGSGGSTSSGGTSNGRAGGSPVGSGGGCSVEMMDPGAQCPAAQTCIETKCKAELDAATSTSGPCGSYIQCNTDCNCDETCANQCTQTTECEASFQSFATCMQSSCITELFSCIPTGMGGGGGSAKTCADLSACCNTLTDPSEKMNCLMVAGLKTELVCSLAYAGFCG